MFYSTNLDLDGFADGFLGCSHGRAVDFFTESIAKDCFVSRHICAGIEDMPVSISVTPLKSRYYCCKRHSRRSICYLSMRMRTDKKRRALKRWRPAVNYRIITIPWQARKASRYKYNAIDII